MVNSEQIKNISIIGHGSTGKTTFTEAVLFTTHRYFQVVYFQEERNFIITKNNERPGDAIEKPESK